ncbi:hypothetical protein D3C86_1640250 [compost metagenome]
MQRHPTKPEYCSGIEGLQLNRLDCSEQEQPLKVLKCGFDVRHPIVPIGTDHRMPRYRLKQLQPGCFPGFAVTRYFRQLREQ